MQILLLGATGFLGRRIHAALERAGHVVHPARHLDLTRPDSIDALVATAPPVEAVVNAAGAVRGRRLDALHHQGPMRLYRGLGIRKVVQVSALGASAEAPAAFLRAKGRGDAALLDWSLEAMVLRPSLVVGRGGGSFALFAALAALPIGVRFGDLTGRVAPVDAETVALRVVALLETPAPGIVTLAGPETLTWDAMIERYRQGFGLAPPRALLAIPRAAFALAGRVDDLVARAGKDNTADAGRGPVLAETLAREAPGPADRLAARLHFLRPVLRGVLALLWIVTGVISLGVHPLDDGLGLLARVGITGGWGLGVLVAASLWDIVLGVGLLFRSTLRLAGWLQVATMGVFSAIIAIGLPEFWLHPFGPITKNFVLVVATLTVLAMEAER